MRETKEGCGGTPWWLSSKESTCNARDAGDLGSIPESGSTDVGFQKGHSSEQYEPHATAGVAAESREKIQTKIHVKRCKGREPRILDESPTWMTFPGPQEALAGGLRWR